MSYIFSCGRRVVVSLQRLQCSVLACGGICGCKSQLKLEDRAEGASPMQSHPSCLLGTGPRMWPLPNLAQAGFGKILSGIYQNPTWKHVSHSPFTSKHWIIGGPLLKPVSWPCKLLVWILWCLCWGMGWDCPWHQVLAWVRKLKMSFNCYSSNSFLILFCLVHLLLTIESDVFLWKLPIFFILSLRECSILCKHHQPAGSLSLCYSLTFKIISWLMISFFYSSLDIFFCYSSTLGKCCRVNLLP